MFHEAFETIVHGQIEQSGAIFLTLRRLSKNSVKKLIALAIFRW